LGYILGEFFHKLIWSPCRGGGGGEALVVADHKKDDTTFVAPFERWFSGATHRHQNVDGFPARVFFVRV
jgi:hypothetical protein